MSNYPNQKKRELSFGPANIHESIDPREMLHAKKHKKYHTFYDYLREHPPSF